jgi:uncharacterized protein YndB with AHSA1/START domain
MTATKKPDEGAKYEMTTTRLLGAPRALVFQAWTDPELLAKWWGPGGFTTTVKKWFPEIGGAILLDMNAPNGAIYPMNGKFVEVTPPETIVFEGAALDPEGEAIFEVLNSVTLAEEGSGTRLTLHAKVLRMRPEARQHLNGQKVGWSQSLDRLEALVTGLKG